MEAMAEAAAQMRQEAAPAAEAGREPDQVSGGKRKRSTKLETAQKKVVDLRSRALILEAKVDNMKRSANKKRDWDRFEADKKKLEELRVEIQAAQKVVDDIRSTMAEKAGCGGGGEGGGDEAAVRCGPDHPV